MNNKTDIDVQYVSPLKKICMTIGELPSSYLETMSYYEMLVWFTEFLKNQVIPTVNNNAEAVQELQSLYEELRTYVNNYFDNLDVQEEINNKLDEMAESGQLTDIIAQYLGLAGMIAFDTVADMKAAENLVNGSKCRTLGFYSVNDDGGAYYKIRTKTNEDVIDEKTIIEVDDETLIAELIFQREMNVECFGAKGDGETDDSLSIQTAIDSPINTLLFGEKTYVVENVIDLGDHEYIGNKTIIELKSDTSREHFFKNKNFGDVTKNDNITIKGITFNSNIQVSILGIHSGSLIVDNCVFYGTNTDAHTMIDLYGNNKNCSITNSKMIVAMEDLTQKGDSLRIRGFIGGESKNIVVSNCYMETNTLDETIWINAGLSSIENVLFENCIINDKGNAANTIWISNGASQGEPLYIKNVTFENCSINKDKLTNRCITVGRIESNDYTYIDCKNILFDNCNIKIGQRTGTQSNTNILIYSIPTLPDHELTVSNSRITYTHENAANSVLNGNLISINNEINANCNYTYIQSYLIKNDRVNNDSGIVTHDVYKIDGLTSSSTVSFMQQHVNDTMHTTTYIENSDISCATLIAASSSKNRTYYIRNNKITNTGYLLNNYGGDSTNVLYVENNHVGTTNYVNNVNCTLYESNNYNATGLIKGIFGNAYTLGSMPVGTIHFSSNATKTIVRKTSDGSSSSNWEEI